MRPSRVKFIAHYSPRGRHRDRTLWVKRSAPGEPVARPPHTTVTRVTPPENRPALAQGLGGASRSASVAQPRPAVPSPRAPSPSQTGPAGKADGAPPCPVAPWAPLSPTRRRQVRSPVEKHRRGLYVHRRREGAGGRAAQNRAGRGRCWARARKKRGPSGLTDPGAD